PDKMTRITVERSSSDQLFMTVFFQSRQVFRKMVNLEKYSDRQYYRSSKFKNRRQASSELSLQSYYKGSKLIGEFSEHSYLPELPTDAEYSGLACEISK
ncbi:MAG: hypothetical protein NTV34_03940, partial [Proteobacteria bacterium]|nr:hypothetical protein [Pseudomonadota bacterium]